MKRIIASAAIFACLFVATARASTDPEMKPAPAKAEMTTAQWSRFSQSLIEGLRSDQESLQQAAMRLVIQYGAKVDVDAAVFDVVRIYRDSPDDRMRRMAVITLGEMRNAWAMEFLARSLPYETTPAVRTQIEAVLAAYEAPAR